jgi:hypothetical protein
MVYGLDYPFSGFDTTQKFVSESTVIHYTCVEQSLKTYFGYYFGGFGDLDNYYSDNPPLLGTVNVTGMIDAVHAQIAFAAQLAQKTHRTFIWPDTVNLLQKRFVEKENKMVLEHRERMAGIRAISWDSARKANLAAVEGNYLDNLKRINHTELETVYLDAHASIPTLEKEISKLSQKQVAILDFAKFSPSISEKKSGEQKRDEFGAAQEEPRPEQGLEQGTESGSEQAPEQQKEEVKPDNTAETAKWLEEKEKEWFRDTFDAGGYRNFSEALLYKLKKCPRADWPSECLGACGGG